MRTCAKCKIEKEDDQYSASRQGKHGPIMRSACKQCQASAARAWFHANKERAKENRHKHSLLANYGITPEKYIEMLERQDSVCAICGLAEPAAHGRTGTQFKLSVDHCHETGKVRGLLCQKCNRAIGLLGDSVDLLRKAIDYLERE